MEAALARIDSATDDDDDGDGDDVLDGEPISEDVRACDIEGSEDDDVVAEPNAKLIQVAAGLLDWLVASESFSLPSAIEYDSTTGTCDFVWAADEAIGYLSVSFEDTKCCALRWPGGVCEQRVLVADFKWRPLPECVACAVNLVRFTVANIGKQ